MTGAADRRGFRWGRAGHSIRGAAAWPGSADSAPDQIESTVGRDGTLDGDGLVPHESLMSVSQSRFGSAAVSSRRTGSSRTGGPTRRLLPRRFADECAEDLVLRTRPPHPPLRRSKPSLGELVGDEPVPERGIVGMHVDRRVDQVRIIPVPARDRILQPPGSRAVSRTSAPDTSPRRGHRRRRVHSRAGRAFWAGQVCLRQIRRRSAKNLDLLLEELHALAQLTVLGRFARADTGPPAPVDLAIFTHRCTHDSEIPKSFAI